MSDDRNEMQKLYDESPELQELLKRANESKSVARRRERQRKIETQPGTDCWENEGGCA